MPRQPGRATPSERSARLIARGRKLLDDWEDESDIDRALELFRQATDLTPGDAEAWRALGDAQHEREEYEQALESYQRAITLGADDVRMWRRIATAAAWVPERTEESVAAAERAQATAPNDAEVLADYAAVLVRAGLPDKRDRLERTLNALDRLVTRLPDDDPSGDVDEVLAGKGGLLILLARYEEALDVFDQLNRNGATREADWAADYAVQMAAYGRALAFDQMGQLTQALECAADGLATEYGPSPLWRAFHADLLVRLGRPHEGLPEAETALEDGADFAYPWRIYAKALEAVGRTDEAREAEMKASAGWDRPRLVEFLLPKP
jgi:tetratricopeptide (TPR) repeat protein